MERLTFVDEDGMVLFENPAGFPEDIGFTIRELAENEEWETLDKIAERLANAEQRLQNYEDLEEQGLLLKLLCKVGDAVYMPYINKILERKIDVINIYRHTIRIHLCNTSLFVEPKDFGKTVFLTRAEAEDALKRM